MKSILTALLCAALLLGVSACKIPSDEQETTKNQQPVSEKTTTKAPEETTTTAPQEEEPTTPPPAELPPTYDGSGFPNPSEDDETKRY